MFWLGSLGFDCVVLIVALVGWLGLVWVVGLGGVVLRINCLLLFGLWFCCYLCSFVD